MPIYTSEVKKGKLSHIALSGAIFNATNFTQLEQSSVRLDVGTESNPITVDGSTVNPFYFLKFFTHLGDPGSFAYSALLINRALQPGEEIIISGYFFRGSDPNTDNNNEAATPIAIVYETSAGNMTDFKTKPASDAYNIGNGGLTDADIIGQGIVPLSNGTNIGALNNGWKYNTTGRSAAASTQVRNINNSADQTDATLCPFNLSAEGSFSSRFYTITIRNDSSSEAFLKILGWDITDAGLDSSKVFSVHDLRVEFDNEITNSVIKAKGISGETDSPLTIRADKNINFKIDHDADDTAKFSFVAGNNAEVANIDESGNLQVDGNLIVDGTGASSIDGGLTVAGDLAVNGDTTTFTSANANDPLVIIKNTANDANSARLQFVKDKGAAGADGDDIGIIEFVGDDAGGNQTPFAKIVAEVSTAADSDEAGKLSLFVAESDGTTTTLTAGLVLEGEHTTDGEVDVTIGAGAASLTTIAGNLKLNNNIVQASDGANTVTIDPSNDRVTVLGGITLGGNLYDSVNSKVVYSTSENGSLSLKTTSSARLLEGGFLGVFQQADGSDWTNNDKEVMFSGSGVSLQVDPATSTSFYSTHGPAGLDNLPIMATDGSGLVETNFSGYYEVSGTLIINSTGTETIEVRVQRNDTLSYSGLALMYSGQVKVTAAQSPMAIHFCSIDYIPSNSDYKIWITVEKIASSTSTTLTAKAGCYLTVKYLGI